ncbi:hypothetical protein AXF42_Ash013783 [Apostasia shenzhenica]|uniref:Transcription repressor n=1 Tax=Apostasia shenzhenica TaxID=1088818 RepID=A0A2I0A4U5_9ASPA|nr:hypothetical protein AXF42_Ash013783 [Apostasia shenzhenica]
MGNYKFKFSDMVPNAWFHKLKDMSRANKIQNRNLHSRTSSPSNQNPSQSDAFLRSRASYYFSGRAEPEKPCSSSLLHSKSSDTVFPPEPPRKSKTRRRRKPISPTANLLSPSVSSSFHRRLPDEDDADDFPCSCKLTSSPTDIIIDVGTKRTELDLRPIATKPVKKETEQVTARKSPAGIHRLRMRASSPRMAARKVQLGRKSVSKREKGLAESFAVVKSSSDPQKDFRDSMVEMIVENNIRKTKDLEELLACYLSLNSKEYHDVIIKEFEQIWFNLMDISSYVKSTT